LPYQTNHFWQERKAGLDQLGQALSTGNTDAAQQAYDALVALGQNGPLRNGETFHRTDRAQDFAAIAQALASGDLAGAQTAFVALASSFGHGISSVGGPPGPPTLIQPPSSVGGGPSGPPEIIPAAIRPPSTVGGTESAVNFHSANANYQLALNLLEPGSNSAAQNSSLSLQA
jgi:hypothetical protein